MHLNFLRLITFVYVGIAGAGLTYLLTPTDKQGTLGSVSTVLEVSVTQAFFMELVLSLILTHVVLMCSDQKEGNTGAIVIGLAYSTLHFVGVSEALLLLFNV